MAFATDILGTLGEFARGLRQELGEAGFSISGLVVSPVAYPFAVFVPLSLWALVVRAFAAGLGILGLGWLASTALLVSADPIVGLFQYAAAFGLAVAMAISAQRRSRRIAALRRSLRDRETDLATASADLDRERLWRRASGGERSTLDDQILVDLAHRVTQRIGVAEAARK